MQGFHKRRNLTEHRIVADHRCLAISLRTFLCKADSLIKFCGSTRPSALISPSCTSDNGQSRNLSFSDPSPLINHERASHEPTKSIPMIISRKLSPLTSFMQERAPTNFRIVGG